MKNNKFKKATLLLSALAMLTVLNSPALYAAEYTLFEAERAAQADFIIPKDSVSIFINGQQLISDDPVTIISDRVFIPLRAVTEAFGASVAWEESTQMITITYKASTVRLTIGSTQAQLILTGETRSLLFDTAPVLINDRTYVPLRAISEAFGADVGWDGNTRTVNISISDGVILEIGTRKIVCGESESELLLALGQPDRQGIGAEGLTWYSYTGDYKEYLSIAVSRGVVCGFMTSSPGFKVSNGVIAGQPFSNNGQTVLAGDSRETLQPAVSAAREEYTDIARSYAMSVYRDEYDNSNVWGVRLIMNGYSMPVDTSSPAYCYEQARQIADLTNGFRVSKGLSPLIWENEAADCAFLHSDDMARSNYYDHISPDGRSVAERYIGAPYIAIDENLICTTLESDSIGMVDCWINSSTQRANILSEIYKHTGVGVVCSAANCYITLVFVAHEVW
jgi:uncharacterized protein YkwD